MRSAFPPGLGQSLKNKKLNTMGEYIGQHAAILDRLLLLNALLAFMVIFMTFFRVFKV